MQQTIWIRTRVWLVTGLGVALVLTAFDVPASAQQPAPSLDRVESKAKAGQALRVEDKKGQVVKGKLVHIDATSLTLEDESRQERRRFAVEDIVRVEKPDRLWSGILIGLVSGMAAGAAMCDCLAGDCCDGQGLGAGLGFAGLGAGIGALVDALIGPQVLFQAPGPRADAPRMHDIAIGFTIGRGRKEEDYFLSGQSWATTVRIGLMKHLALDVEVGKWGGSSRIEDMGDQSWVEGTFPDTTLVEEPTHRIVLFDLSESHLAAQAIARLPFGRATLWGGGGLGVWGQDTYQLYQEYSLVNSEHWREDTRTGRRTGLGALGSAGADLNLTRRLALSGTGGVQFVPTLDTLAFTFQGGVRVLF